MYIRQATDRRGSGLKRARKSTSSIRFHHVSRILSQCRMKLYISLYITKSRFYMCPVPIVNIFNIWWKWVHVCTAGAKKNPYNYNGNIGCSIEDESLSNTFQILPIRPLTRQIKFNGDSKLHTLFCCGCHTFVPLPRLPEQVKNRYLAPWRRKFLEQ